MENTQEKLALPNFLPKAPCPPLLSKEGYQLVIIPKRIILQRHSVKPIEK
jgi:hypothetical protein